jgi:multiple sugar transport system substrate-binding protein
VIKPPAVLGKLNNIDWKSHADLFLFALALIVLAAGLFRSCGSPVLERRPRFVTGSAGSALVFTYWPYGGLEVGVIEDIVAEFRDLHPEISVTPDPKSYRELRRLLFEYEPPSETGAGKTGAAGFGDVIAVDPLWVPELINNGALDPSFKTAALLRSINLLFYNITVLKEAGFSRPPKTRSEFLEFCRAVSGAGRYGLALALNGGSRDDSADSGGAVYQDIWSWIWAGDGRLFTGGRPAANSKPVADTLEFFSALNGEGLIYPRPFTMNGEQKREAFINGRAVFIAGSAQDIEVFKKAMGENSFGVTSIPVPDGYAGKPLFGSTAWGIGISKQSAWGGEARIFAAFLEEKKAVLAEKTRAVPGSGESPAQTPTDPLYAKVWDLYTSGDIIQEFIDIANINTPNEKINEKINETINETILEEEFRESLVPLFSGTADAMGTAETIQRRWEALFQ